MSNGTDAFSVTAAYDKLAYSAGDTMTVTISGNDVLTTQNIAQSGTLTIQLKAADGAVQTFTLGPVNVSTTIATPESVTMTGIVDTSGRVWTVNADGLSATATA